LVCCRWVRNLKKCEMWTHSSLRSVNCERMIQGSFTFYRQKSAKFDTHGSVHRRLLSRNTNKMQLCNRIYYSEAFWRLNMFRAAHRSSSGALNCICSHWFICPYDDWPLPRLSGKWIHFPLSLGNGRSPYGHLNQRLQIQFTAPDVKRCVARSMLSLQKHWNNKFYYKAASCWYFYWEVC